MRWLKLSLICSVFGLTACVGSEPVVEAGDPYYAPVQPSSMEPPPPTDGSLYQQQYSQQLFGDRKAYRVGDVITIVLQEQTSSTKSAKTDIKRESNIDLPTPTIFGRTRMNLGTTFDGSSDFKGDSSADQSNSLTGQITVTVHQVLPNGNLQVRGEKWLNLNQGSEFIRVSGIVRPDDIQPNNTVASRHLADARLTYSGTGDLADSNKQGWLTRFFNSGWWPF